MAMARGKTGALVGCSCALGELYASGDPERAARAHRFGMSLGLAFQLVDDILGIWGDPAVTGKPAHSDLTRRKKSPPVVATLNSGIPEARELAELYFSSDPLTPADVARAADVVTASGGCAWTEAEASRQLDAALDELSASGASGRAATELEALARLVTKP